MGETSGKIQFKFEATVPPVVADLKLHNDELFAIHVLAFVFMFFKRFYVLFRLGYIENSAENAESLERGFMTFRSRCVVPEHGNLFDYFFKKVKVTPGEIQISEAEHFTLQFEVSVKSRFCNNFCVWLGYQPRVFPENTPEEIRQIHQAYLDDFARITIGFKDVYTVAPGFIPGIIYSMQPMLEVDTVFSVFNRIYPREYKPGTCLATHMPLIVRRQIETSEGKRFLRVHQMHVTFTANDDDYSISNIDGRPDHPMKFTKMMPVRSSSTRELKASLGLKHEFPAMLAMKGPDNHQETFLICAHSEDLKNFLLEPIYEANVTVNTFVESNNQEGAKKVDSLLQFHDWVFHSDLYTVYELLGRIA